MLEENCLFVLEKIGNRKDRQTIITQSAIIEITYNPVEFTTSCEAPPRYAINANHGLQRRGVGEERRIGGTEGTRRYRAVT